MCLVSQHVYENHGAKDLGTLEPTWFAGSNAWFQVTIVSQSLTKSLNPRKTKLSAKRWLFADQGN